MEPKKYTRDEWQRSEEHIILRFLNNMCAGVVHKAQETNDVLDLLVAKNPDLPAYDRYSVVERQLRIVSLEAARLWDEARKLVVLLEPKKFED